MDNKERSIYKVTLKGNLKQNEVSVNFNPGLKDAKQMDVQYLLNTLISGSHSAFVKLLGGLPMLRPATEEERELQVYIFADEEKDNKAYQARLQLYNQLEGVFTTTLEQLFPDIRYIQQSNEFRQERILEMNEDEANDYKQEVEDLAKQIREALSKEKGTA